MREGFAKLPFQKTWLWEFMAGKLLQKLGCDLGVLEGKTRSYVADATKRFNRKKNVAAPPTYVGSLSDDDDDDTDQKGRVVKEDYV